VNNANDAFWLYYFALARCPPGILHFIRKLITILTILARPPGPFLTNRTKNNCWNCQCMEWQRYIYFTCKQQIFIYWNYRWD